MQICVFWYSAYKKGEHLKNQPSKHIDSRLMLTLMFKDHCRTGSNPKTLSRSSVALKVAFEN